MPTPAQLVYSQTAGWLPPNPGGGIGNSSNNAAANWFAVSFVPDQDRTVSAVNLTFRALTGTLAATDVSCTIYSSTATAGVEAPNAAISAASTTVTPALVAGSLGAFVQFTGFTQAVTAGTVYWAVIKNLNATPATNFPNWRYTNRGAVQTFARDFQASVSTNSGGTWTVGSQAAGCYRIDYADGAADGAPLLLIAASLTGIEVYGTREAGNVFTLPAGVSPNVRGIAIQMTKLGTPAGNIRFRLYSGTTLLGTTRVAAAARISTGPLVSGDAFVLLFASPITVPAGAVVRMTVGTTTGGDASNYYSPVVSQINNDALSKTLFPFNSTGVIQHTYFDGSTWTNTDTLIAQMALILDSTTPFASPWPIGRASLTGGLE